jgi:spore coat polysaccharide biosynthesis protein SpsF
MSSDTVLTIVQARTGSTRLPGKVLQEIDGRPMLRFMLDRLAPLDVDHRVVATSSLERDDAVAEIATAAGWGVVRGSESDVLARFVAALDAHPAAHVVRLTADCPLSDAQLVEHVIARHVDGRADYTANVFPRTYPKGLDVEVVRAEALRLAAREATDVAEREHVTPFVYRRPECFRLANVRNDVALGDERWTVDTAEDLESVRALVTRMGDDRFSWEDALKVVGPQFVSPRGAVQLLPAMPDDQEFVLACRADAEAVRWSRSGRAITPDEHAGWYPTVLDQPGTRLRIALVDGEPVGTLRVDVAGGAGEVGIAIVPERRGQGLGRALLGALVADCAADPQVNVLEACVHPDNGASMRSFLAAGFTLTDEDRRGFRVLRRPVHQPMEMA